VKNYRSTLLIVALLAGCTASQQQTAQNLASSAPQQAADVVLAGAIKAKLATIDLDSSTAVSVQVVHGKATLTGRVKSVDTRTAFEKAAKSLAGITAVDDRTRIDPHLHGAGEQVTDAALATAVSANILAQAGVNTFKVKPEVQGGVVTLNGTAPTQEIKTTILEAARKTAGVKAVIDHLAVK